MRINQKILSIPPYLSTPWKNIASLRAEEHTKDYTLIVTLLDGTLTEIPHLQKQIVDAIFAAHAKFYDMDKPANRLAIPLTPETTPAGFSFKMSLPGMEGLSSALQHNQEQYDSSDLPAEVLEKISGLTQMMDQEEINAIPKPEPHCNCPHCQITRAIHHGGERKPLKEINTVKEEEEEIVTDEDLHFRTWDIKQTADHLYLVTNPLDTQEHYNVFLSSPVGCTCGSKNCEHIKAVLSS